MMALLIGVAGGWVTGVTGGIADVVLIGERGAKRSKSPGVMLSNPRAHREPIGGRRGAARDLFDDGPRHAVFERHNEL